MTDTIRLETDARGVATLWLARAEKRNALSPEMMDALTAIAEEINAAEAVRVVILRGEGAIFCAGGDLDWMRRQFDASSETRMVEARRLAGMLQALNTLTKPLIGRIQGAAMGGGVGMASVCDVVIAEETAKFGLTETRLGLIPATISPYVIARMGEGRARRVFMSSRVFAAPEAVELGIVARAVPEAELDAAIEFEVAPYLSASPKAVAAAKELARSLGPRIDAEVIEATAQHLAAVWDGGDAAEGVGAFFEKRKPRWAE